MPWFSAEVGVPALTAISGSPRSEQLNSRPSIPPRVSAPAQLVPLDARHMLRCDTPMIDGTKRDHAPPGPVPTIGELAAGATWVWAHCAVPCNHSAAIPLAPIIARFGPETSSDRLRSALQCSLCGRRGVEIVIPRWADPQRGYAKLPVDRVPPQLREEME